MIKTLKLTDFRNHSKKEFEFDEKMTMIVGENASGKTNILEALFILSTGKSFKAKQESEMLRYGTNLTRIIGESEKQNLECIITDGSNSWQKKKLMVNGVPRRSIDFAGNFKTIIFLPSDMDLVSSSPSLRRKFLDTVLSQTDREYRRALLTYEKGVRQRNRLLFRIREEGVSRSQLLFWNQLLIKNGNYITDQREKFINNTNKYQLQIPNNYQLQYDRSEISEKRLEQYAREEVASATTLVGPHRDDFEFQMLNAININAKSLASYGSRGQQRMGVLWLKMAELSYVEEITGEKPTLLLDDIFSELDHDHRKIVLDTITNYQTIMTTADVHYVPTAISNLQLSVINL